MRWPSQYYASTLHVNIAGRQRICIFLVIIVLTRIDRYNAQRIVTDPISNTQKNLDVSTGTWVQHSIIKDLDVTTLAKTHRHVSYGSGCRRSIGFSFPCVFRSSPTRRPSSSIPRSQLLVARSAPVPDADGLSIQGAAAAVAATSASAVVLFIAAVATADPDSPIPGFLVPLLKVLDGKGAAAKGWDASKETLPEPLQSFLSIDPWGAGMPEYPTDLLNGLELPKDKQIFMEYESAFSRMDETEDKVFYSTPRFVYHIDQGAIAALTDHYSVAFQDLPKERDHLDLCCSWVSFLPPDHVGKCKSVVGIGMNAEELHSNPQLTNFQTYDLNQNSTLPFNDCSFDVVTNVVSVDYLNKPLQIVGEVHRVLKPGGVALFSFSNRMFREKVVKLWGLANE
eukprot:gnl/MRDRNA2_/MRDRNA2_26245_c0_seq1.p1 gnl/MRDRNA2_/MRDRNA2_26245_c0~~gnl/MRDRNA2_/MRDRNA2_26245_c0_seq1.p1  ORF type:complete len:396 (-),score=65.29 gnl/MRDRNA2_/MRDRNA2_26245_c0_seq1:14-1201(-)